MITEFEKQKVAKGRKKPLSETEAKKVTDFIFNNFFGVGKDVIAVSGGSLRVFKTEKSFRDGLENEIERHLRVKITKLDEDKYVDLININLIYTYVTSYNRYSLIKYESDLFAKEQIIKKNFNAETITIIQNELHIEKPNSENINISESEYNEYNEVVADYISHFPQIEDILMQVMDMRFAKDRKTSFLHLQTPSNWGKSFFSKLLKSLGIALEMDYSNIANKATNSINALEVRNSFVLIIDEFTNFSQEMKKITHEIDIVAKYESRQIVEVYLKIFLSAEDVGSFTGAVDKQIANRVSQIKIDKSVDLGDREVFKKYGNEKYSAYLKRYIYIALTNRMSSYLKLDRFKASKVADKNVQKFHNKFKLKVVTDTLHNALEIAKFGLLEMAEMATLSDSQMNIFVPDIYKNIHQNVMLISGGKYAGHIIVKSPTKTIEAILRNVSSEADYKKLRFKISEVENKLRTESYPLKIKQNGKIINGLIVSVDSLKSEMEMQNDS